MIVERRLQTRQIVRMHAVEPERWRAQIVAVADADDGVPARRAVQRASSEIPVPETVVRATRGHGNPLIWRPLGPSISPGLSIDRRYAARLGPSPEHPERLGQPFELQDAGAGKRGRRRTCLDRLNGVG